MIGMNYWNNVLNHSIFIQINAHCFPVRNNNISYIYFLINFSISEPFLISVQLISKS